MNNLLSIKNKNYFKDQRVLLVLVILLITISVSIAKPQFIAISNIVAIFQQISVLGILTMAMTMIMLSGGVDLSVGNIMVLSAVVNSKIIMSGGNIVVAIAAGLLIGLICGLINGVIVSKSKCVPLIITLGTSQMFYGASLMITNGRYMNFAGAFNFIGKTKIFTVFPVMLFFLAFIVCLTYIIINKTKFGRRIIAIGGNEDNAFLSGIHVDKQKIYTYALGGVICSIAAIVFVSRLDSVTAGAGSGYELEAMTAAIIGGVTFSGGRGTIFGAFLGVLLMGIITNAMNILHVWAYAQEAISGAIIVVAVILSNLDKIKRIR